jgi:type VII secretion-associated serine protease mycosin
VVAACVAVLVAVVGGPAAAVDHSSAAVGARRAVPVPDMGENGEWWFTSWQIPKVWAAGARGQGVTVAVIDSGVQASRPELRGVVLAGTDFHGGDGRSDLSRQVDGDTRGHGTAMALFIAGQGGPSGLVGVAPAAKILPLVRQKDSGEITRSIRWAVDHGAKVINMSYGHGGVCSDDDQAAVRYAIDHGAVVVAGAGNEGIYSEVGPGRPANCPGVLSVGAIDNQLRAWRKSNSGPFVGVVAPGVHMRTINLAGARGYSDGTSDATALTSGAIALVWSKYPQLTNRQVVARVLATARDLGAPGRDDVYGYGVVKPIAALTADVAADAANPIFDRLPARTATADPSTAPGEDAAADPAAPSPTIAGISLLTLLVLGGGAVLVVVVLAVVVAVALAGRSSRRRAHQPTHQPLQPPGGGFPAQPPGSAPSTPPPSPGQPPPPSPGQHPGQYPGQPPS